MSFVKNLLARVDAAIESDIDKSIAERPIPVVNPVRLIGANLEAIASESLRNIETLHTTERLIEAEIVRLSGELRNTQVALAAAHAKHRVLADAHAEDEQRAEAALDGFSFDDDDKPLDMSGMLGHTSPERRLEEYAQDITNTPRGQEAVSRYHGDDNGA